MAREKKILRKTRGTDLLIKKKESAIINRNFETPIIIPIENLDRRYVGYFTYRDIIDKNGNTLLSANLELNAIFIDGIRKNYDRVVPGNHSIGNIWLKKNISGRIPEPMTILSDEDNKNIFEGLSPNFDKIRRKFSGKFNDINDLIQHKKSEINEQLKKIGLTLDKEFKKYLYEVIETIMKDKDKALLFACMDELDNDILGHGLRVFTVATKMLSRHYNPILGRVDHSKKLLNYSLGFIYHDIGKMIVPKEILNKNNRFTDTELISIAEGFKRESVSSEFFKIIVNINNPRIIFKGKEKIEIINKIEEMEFLIGRNILTYEQYKTLKQFPHYSVFTDHERDIMERHTLWGWEIIKSSNFPHLQTLDIIRHHHERLDGSGYPDKIQNMSDEAQICAIVDVYDAMTNVRGYKNPLAHDKAFEQLDEMTTPKDGITPKLSRWVYELFCQCIQKYPVGSFIIMTRGEYRGYIAQITGCASGEHTRNKPEFIIIRDSGGNRLDDGILFERKNYDGSFSFRGLPFTKELTDKIMGQ